MSARLNSKRILSNKQDIFEKFQIDSSGITRYFLGIAHPRQPVEVAMVATTDSFKEARNESVAKWMVCFLPGDDLITMGAFGFALKEGARTVTEVKNLIYAKRSVDPREPGFPSRITLEAGDLRALALRLGRITQKIHPYRKNVEIIKYTSIGEFEEQHVSLTEDGWAIWDPIYEYLKNAGQCDS